MEYTDTKTYTDMGSCLNTGNLSIPKDDKNPHYREYLKRVAQGKAVTEEEPDVSLELVRTERNRLLAESDWTQLADAPLSQQEISQWATYRQSLRDLPTAIDRTGKKHIKGVKAQFPKKP